MQSQGPVGAVRAMACAAPEALQSLPSFFLIGPPRTGTSWLHEVLSRHTLLPSSTKETRFFDVHFHRGLKWYRAHYPKRFGHRMMGEVAPTYFASPKARERIVQMVPTARMVCIFRHPIDRVVSLYRVKRAYGMIPWGFEEALVLAYREAEGEMLKVEHDALLQLQQMLARYNSKWTKPEADSALIGIELPTIGTPSIVLELNEAWWRRWWRPGRTGDRRATVLARLIESEFAAIAGTLTQAARTQLEARHASALQEANLIYAGLIDTLQGQKRARIERQNAARASEDLLRDSPELQRQRESDIAELKKQATDMGLLADRLERVDHDVRGAS